MPHKGRNVPPVANTPPTPPGPNADRWMLFDLRLHTILTPEEYRAWRAYAHDAIQRGGTPGPMPMGERIVAKINADPIARQVFASIEVPIEVGQSAAERKEDGT